MLAARFWKANWRPAYLAEAVVEVAAAGNGAADELRVQRTAPHQHVAVVGKVAVVLGAHGVAKVADAHVAVDLEARAVL